VTQKTNPIALIILSLMAVGGLLLFAFGVLAVTDFGMSTKFGYWSCGMGILSCAAAGRTVNLIRRSKG
jgi:MFS-type transporter involved in bile tolerance (Atg22 family)